MAEFDDKITAVRMPINEVREALRINEEFFIQFFLAEQLVYPVPDFHKTSFNMLVSSSVSRIALALPRGTAKTTLAKLAVVWYFLFSDTRFIVYVSNTHTFAVNACRDIINFITSENFVAVFGSVEWETRQEGAGFYIFKLLGKRCILRALGAGQQTRGMNVDNQRPELAVVDDLEDDENTATEALQEKLKQWFFGPFQKALWQLNNKIIYLGNMLSVKSLLYYFCRPETEHWHSMRYGILLEGGKSLWPEVFPLELIKQDYKEYKDAGMTGRWFAEMMNMPMPNSSPLIKSDEIQYSGPKMPEDIQYGFITYDPAVSLKTWADNTGIACHGFVMRTGKWQILETFCGKVEPEKGFLIAMDMALRWRFRVIGIEKAAMQASLQYLFKVYLKIHGFEGQIEFVELPHGQNTKTERLAAWCSMIRKDQYCITEGDYVITEQLLNYNPEKKENEDDIIDACAYGPIMIMQYLHMIAQYQNPVLIDMYAVKGTYETARL